MAVLGLRFCARAFSSCGERGPLFIAVRGPLTIAASLVAEHRLQTRRLSNCGSRAQLLRGMWDLPRPGLEPMSAALAGGFSTTAPPGKPSSPILDELLWSLNLASGGFLAALSFISNCLNLGFGTQGTSWRLESCLQETVDKKGLHAQEPHRALVSFTPPFL